MTMRTYTYFVCPNGHKGHEKVSENDQPYSKNWERIELTGIARGQAGFVCEVCGQPMTETTK